MTTSLVMLEGFDHYSSLGYKWDTVSSGVSIVDGIGKNSTRAARFTSWNNHLIKDSPYFNNSNTLGFRRKFSSLPPSNVILCSFNSSTGYLALELTSGGLLRIVKSNGTVLGTGLAISTGVYYYMELGALINAAGSAELHVNEVPSIVFSGDTTIGGDSSISSFNINHSTNSSSAATIDVDDIYMHAELEFFGNTHIETYKPNANGISTEWEPFGQATNLLSVEDTVADNDADVNRSQFYDERDSFTFQPVALTKTVKAVQYSAISRRTNIAYKAIALITRKSGSDITGGSCCLDLTYNACMLTLGVDPSDSNAWTPARINATEFGYNNAQLCCP